MKLNKKNKNSISIVLLFLTIIFACGGIIFMIKSEGILSPDYAPGVVDKNAVPLPDDGEKLSASEGGGAVTLSYSNKTSVNLETKEVKLYFQNPSESTHNIAIQIIIEQNDKKYVIAQSEIVPVGYAIYKLKLIDDAKLLTGGYDGVFNVMYYDVDSNDKAMVNTNIPITIAVE